uniref:Uncharacterized protein n=1 Tax=Amphimedon queenslandica TaxID=400682 RepID=A0A1X7U0Z2_AMPQE
MVRAKYCCIIILQIINYVHDDVHIYVRISTTRDQRHDWCGLKENEKYPFC